MSVIGIDIGGTNIRIGHDDNGELKDFVKISTKDNLKQGKIVECLADIIKKYMLYFWDKYEQKIADDGIGIGIYIGTGVGNAIFINGKPLAGKDGAAGELGHIPMIGGKEQCGCGNLGCSECYASGWKLVQIKDKCFPETTMNELFVKHSNSHILREYVDAIACVACSEINILNPDSIIFGGGVINMKGFPKELLEERLYVHARKPYPAENLDIKYSVDKPDNGVKGAIIFAKTLI